MNDLDKEKKVLLITNIPTPYRLPVYQELAKMFPEFTVWFLSHIESNRAWREIKPAGFDYTFLGSPYRFQFHKKDFDIHVGGIWFRLIRHKPDVVITAGYDQLQYLQAKLYCALFGKDHVLWCGSTLESSAHTSGFFGKMKQWLVRGSSAYIAYGTQAAAYLRFFGVPGSLIEVGCNAVDSQELSHRVRTFRQSSEFQERKGSYQGKTVFLTTSRFVASKGIQYIINVFGRLDDIRDRCFFVFVGDGPFREELEKRVPSGWRSHVAFVGFVQPEDIHTWYALSDFFIFPTQREPWGLVVNEALAAGVPVICSYKAGAASDLIQEGINGAVVDVTHTEQLTHAIRAACAGTLVHAKMPIADTIDHCNPRAYAVSIQRAIHIALTSDHV